MAKIPSVSDFYPKGQQIIELTGLNHGNMDFQMGHRMPGQRAVIQSDCKLVPGLAKGARPLESLAPLYIPVGTSLDEFFGLELPRRIASGYSAAKTDRKPPASTYGSFEELRSSAQ